MTARELLHILSTPGVQLDGKVWIGTEIPGLWELTRVFIDDDRVRLTDESE